MNTPLRTIWQAGGAPTLMVLLPGAYMQAADFVHAGFFAAVSDRQLPLDLVAVDIDLTRTSSGDALTTLQAEIIAPARQRGYRRIWLGGISLGALQALCHTADRPGSVDGLCLLAPYPGSRLTAKAIAGAGGMSAWRPSGDELADPEFRVWHWLQDPPVDFPVFVGYGSEDRFVDGMRAIAGCFPPSASHAVAGGHEWPVWKHLWEHFLDNEFLPV